jgi:5-methylcytosine-specific restriction protein A
MRLCRCGKIVKERCPDCEPHTAKKVKRSHKWKRVAERHKKNNPLCVKCMENGKIKASEETHHIVPVSVNRDLEFAPDNLMALCKECHKEMDRIAFGGKEYK